MPPAPLLHVFTSQQVHKDFTIPIQYYVTDNSIVEIKLQYRFETLLLSTKELLTSVRTSLQ